MTIKELVEQLSTFPPELIVKIPGGGYDGSEPEDPSKFRVSTDWRTEKYKDKRGHNLTRQVKDVPTLFIDI